MVINARESCLEIGNTVEYMGPHVSGNNMHSPCPDLFPKLVLLKLLFSRDPWAVLSGL